METMNSHCSNENLQIYRSWFSFADSDGDGRLTGSDATNIFAMSNLSNPQLKLVWALSDSKKQGFLGLDEFVTAMQLISLGQEGHEINSALLKNRVNLETLNPPVMEGLADLISKSSRHALNVKPVLNGTPWPSFTPRVSSVGSKGVKKSHSFVGAVTSVTDGLKWIYIEKLKPLEDTYRFSDFGFPILTSNDFDSKPMVMLLGQYSTGKTTFIKHLLGCAYPGAHIGPEPTTDRFIVVMSGPDERSIPGNTVAVQADMPFGGLTTFGGAFLSKFECSQMPHPGRELEHANRTEPSNRITTVRRG